MIRRARCYCVVGELSTPSVKSKLQAHALSQRLSKVFHLCQKLVLCLIPKTLVGLLELSASEAIALPASGAGRTWSVNSHSASTETVRIALRLNFDRINRFGVRIRPVALPS